MSTLSPRRPRVKPARRCLLAGEVLKLTVGQSTDVYAFRQLPADFGVGAQVTKQEPVRDEAGRLVEVRDGEVYHVLANPKDGRHSCDCLGFLRHGHCKHVEALSALLARGKLAPLPHPTAAA